jgi:hypothetical protein
MTVKRAVGAVLSRGASWIQGRDGGGEVEIARLSSMKSRSFLKSGKNSVSWGSVLRIRDVYPGPRIRIFSITDPHESIFTQKNGFDALGNMIRVVHSGSGSGYQIRIRIRIPDPDPEFLPIPDTKVKKAPDPGSGTRQFAGIGPARTLLSAHGSIFEL